MFFDYLKFSWRHFQRGVGNSVIKVIGLTLGITSFLLSCFFVVEELSYDGYHQKRASIFRVGYAVREKKSNETDSMAWVSSLVGPQLKRDYPEVEQFARVRNLGGTMEYKDQRFIERGLFFADASVFDVFDFPFAKGDAHTALADPYTMVMTEKMADKYFGEQWMDVDLSSQHLVFYMGDTLRLQVTGIIRDIPKNSHFTFDGLVSYKTREAIYDHINGWFSLGTHTYILTTPRTRQEDFASKIRGMVMKYYGEEAVKLGYELTLFLQPLSDIHLHSKLSHEIQPNADIQHVRIFSGLGIFILVLAIMNFVNLSTARSPKFAKQSGIRKVAGSTRFQLVKLFMMDSFFYAAFAGLLSLGALELILPFFQEFIGRDVAGMMDKPQIFGSIFLTLIFLVTLFGGGYPAKILSSVKPAAILKGYGTSIEAGKLRYALIIFQFSISVIIAIGVLTIYSQMSFMLNKPLGYNKENIVVIDAWMNNSFATQRNILRNELANQSFVENVTFSQSVPGQGLLERTTRPEGTDQWTVMETLVTDYDFLDTYGFGLSTGRTFSEYIESDRNHGFMINQAAARTFGWSDTEAIGKKIEWGTRKQGSIIGVVKDFHYRSLHERINPVVIHVAENGGYISVHLKKDQLRNNIRDLETLYKKLYPDQVFQYFVLDENFDLQYAGDKKLGSLTLIFCILAFFIASIGLVGLSAVILESKRKEISVRKVLGATPLNIILLLNGKFAGLVLAAVCVASPIAYYGSQQWLENFAYRTSLSVWAFLVAGALAVAIAVLTVSFHAIKGARINPTENLKYE